MRVSKQIILVCILVISVLVWFNPVLVQANPVFFIEGTSSGVFKQNTTWDIKLNSDGQLLTAAQTIVEFDKELFNQVQLSNLNSRCSFWAPADPALNLGNSVTPYFLEGDKIVLACGFSRPGYNTSNGVGDKLLSFTLEPFYIGVASFSFRDTQFRYVEAVIEPGTIVGFDYAVTSTFAATPSPTPVPTPAPVLPTPTTLSASDLNFVDVTAARRAREATMSGSTNPLDANAGTAVMDDTIPPPPSDLEQRPAATPYVFDQTNQDETDKGEVLSIQSLRELLVPGKSDADKRLVIFNLVMIMTFLVLLAIVIWRLIIAKRTHKLKMKHMNELIEGELSVIESKVQAVKQGYGNSDDVMSSLDELKKELDNQGV